MARITVNRNTSKQPVEVYDSCHLALNTRIETCHMVVLVLNVLSSQAPAPNLLFFWYHVLSICMQCGRQRWWYNDFKTLAIAA